MPPDRRPPSRSRSPEELDGYLAGLRHALDRQRSDGAADPSDEALWENARTALQGGHRDEAARSLRELDDRLRSRREEPELHEFPRGLVSYVPKGGRGAPLPPEEEPLENRRRLILRLTEVVELNPPDRERVLGELAHAEHAIARGDRRGAKQHIDTAHSIVEDAAGP